MIFFALFEMLTSKTAWVYLPFKNSCLIPIYMYAPMRMWSAKTIGVLKMYPVQDNRTFTLCFAIHCVQHQSLYVNDISW